MTDLVSPETITEITQTFWEAYLPDDAVLMPGAQLPGSDDIAGRVDIEGGFTGSVEMSCSMAVARRVGAVMFGIPEEMLSESDVADAVGELVNVVGGSIKSILPPPTSLSIPTVGDDLEWREGAVLESEVMLTWAGEPLVVRLWMRPV